MKNGRFVEDGVERWYKDDVPHRLDGPAVSGNGEQAWYAGNRTHRLDGPDESSTNEYQAWYVEGKLHRLDGPAVINPSGSQEWWVDGRAILLKHLSALGISDYPETGFTDEQIAMLRVIL